jgi:hypothetical protein
LLSVCGYYTTKNTVCQYPVEEKIVKNAKNSIFCGKLLVFAGIFCFEGNPGIFDNSAPNGATLFYGTSGNSLF